jgi:uncharacterized protein (DUF697 family)
MAKLPVNPGKLFEAWKEVSSTTATAATLVLAGDAGLVESARSRFGSGAQPLVHSGGVESLGSLSAAHGQIPLVLTSPTGEDTAETLLADARPPSGAVVVVDEGPLATDSVVWYESGVARVSFSGEDSGWEAVYRAVLMVAPALAVALGTKYEPLRAGAATRVVSRTARQNALVAVVFSTPGADMPIMTLNEAKMILTIASIYGHGLTLDRAIELLGVVGAGFTFRRVVRELSGFVPGPGWVLKGTIGYTATKALGEAAIRYFEAGAPATPTRLAGLVRRLKR